MVRGALDVTAVGDTPEALVAASVEEVLVVEALAAAVVEVEVEAPAEDFKKGEI
jgi:hypothetical protein